MTTALQQWRNAMIESNQTSAAPLSVSKVEQKGKIFYEHGKDALGLALSVAGMQEEKALRKAEKHRQPQAGKSRKDRNCASNKRKRLEEAKVMIANRRAEAKKEKARTRKEFKGRLRRGDGVEITALEDTTSAAPRKKVSFA